MKMKRQLIFYLLLCITIYCPNLLAQPCDSGATQTTITGNNVDARLIVNGSFWWDGLNSHYYVPANSNVSAFFAGGLWLGALDEGDNLRVAANTYGASPNQGTSDFFAGPIDAQTGFTDSLTCANYNRFWEVKKAEIDQIRLDWDDNGQIDGTVPENIAGWPAIGNPFFADLFGFELPIGQGMAPFFDQNQDGNYNPMQGDYPYIKGADQAVWWVFNDIGGIHTSSTGDVLFIEIQAMSYSYNSPNEALNNATYYDLKMINRGSEDLSELHAALWIDPDLGCYTDDYIGCQPERNLAFVYNEDAVDGDAPGSCECFGVPTYCEEVPIAGVKILKGLLDENGEDLGMSSFAYYNNGGSNPAPPAGTTDPNTALEYYNIMKGLQTDGNPVTNPTTGEVTKFAFPGDPSDETDWSMCSVSAGGGDRRMIIGSGPAKIPSGAVQEISFAVIWVPNVAHPCPNLEGLIEACEVVENVDPTSVKSIKANSNLIQLYPNPMELESSILKTDPEVQLVSVDLYNINGQHLRTYEDVGQTLEIKRGNLATGLYLYKAQTTTGEIFTGKLMVR